MAKRPKRRPLRPPQSGRKPVQSQDEQSRASQWQASTVLHPSTIAFIPSTRRLALAHAKHAPTPSPPTPVKPTLADRFHALPTELRASIFALLLVRPVKWDLPHLNDPQTCDRLILSQDITPALRRSGRATCVRCVTDRHEHQRIPLWRSRQMLDLALYTWMNPWRSDWAPEVRNEFMCSDCWDDEWRPRPHPWQKELRRHLRCLCARRQDLGLLLVCRRWYEEAGQIFYSRNCFAFEDSATFVAFTQNLDVRWRNLITRISIMAYHPEDFINSPSKEERESEFESSKKLAPVWTWLRRLPSLSYLELDAHFLEREKAVQAMLRLGLTNVRRVCFTFHNARANYPIGRAWVWPEYHNAKLFVGGLAEEVARAIKGQRSMLLKKRGEIARAIEREAKQLDHVKNLPHHSVATGGNVHYHSDLEEWERLWCQVGYQHAYLPSDYAHGLSYRKTWRAVHWREWGRCTPFAYADELERERSEAERVEGEVGMDFMFLFDVESHLTEGG